jgi:hypothetical protein
MDGFSLLQTTTAAGVFLATTITPATGCRFLSRQQGRIGDELATD